MKPGPAVMKRNQTDGRAQTNTHINNDSTRISAYLHNTRLMSRIFKNMNSVNISSVQEHGNFTLPSCSINSLYSQTTFSKFHMKPYFV